MGTSGKSYTINDFRSRVIIPPQTLSVARSHCNSRFRGGGGGGKEGRKKMQREQKEAKDKDKGRTLKPAPPKRGIPG